MLARGFRDHLALLFLGNGKPQHHSRQHVAEHHSSPYDSQEAETARKWNQIIKPQVCDLFLPSRLHL